LNQQSRINQAGVALAVLLWFIAAMSLLVSGILYQVKNDMKISQWELQKAQAEALGDGASNLALAQLSDGEAEDIGRLVVVESELEGSHIITELISISGLLDINSLSKDGLISLFVHGASLEEAQAEQLAANVLDWRSYNQLRRPEVESAYRGSTGKLARFGRFEAPEDLLQVLGVTRDIYEKLSATIYAGEKDVNNVNLAFAPFSVLMVLAQGDEALAVEWESQRELFQSGNRPPELTGFVTGNQVIPVYRSSSFVKMADGQWMKRVRWADIGAKGRDYLPWRIVRTEKVVKVKSSKYLEIRQ